MRSGLREFGVRSLGEVAVGNFAVAGFAALTGIVLARGLQPTGRGELALAMTTAGLAAAVVGLGSRSALLFNVAKARPEARLTWISGSRVLVACSTGFATLVALIALSTLQSDSGLVAVLLVAFMSVPLVVAGGIPSAITQVDNMRLWNVIRLLGPIGYFVGVLLLTMAAAVTPVAAAAAYTISTAVASLIAFLLVSDSRRPPWLRTDPEVLRARLSYGSRALFSGLSKTVTARLDVLVLGLVASIDEVGIYAVALGASSIVGPLGSMFSPSLTPRVAAAASRSEQRRLTLTAIVWGAATMVFSAGVAFLLAPTVLPVLLGPGWTDATTPFRVLLLAVVFRSLSESLGASLSGAGKPGQTSVAATVASVVTAIAIGPLVGAFGPTGAAITAVLATLASFTTLALSCRRTFSSPREERDDEPALAGHQRDAR